MRAHAWARGSCAPIAAAASIVAGACGSDPTGFGRTYTSSVPLLQAPAQAAGTATGQPAADAHTRGRGAMSWGAARGGAGRPGPWPSRAASPPAQSTRAGGTGTSTPLPGGQGIPQAAPKGPRHADVDDSHPRVGSAGRRTWPMSDHTSAPPTAGRQHEPPFSSLPGPLSHSAGRGSVDLAGTMAAAAQQGGRTNGPRRQRCGPQGTVAPHFPRRSARRRPYPFLAFLAEVRPGILGDRGRSERAR